MPKKNSFFYILELLSQLSIQIFHSSDVFAFEINETVVQMLCILRVIRKTFESLSVELKLMMKSFCSLLTEDSKRPFLSVDEMR